METTSFDPDARHEKSHRDFQPTRALRAIRALVKNPEDLPQVFTIIESLSGPAPRLMFQRFSRSPSGQQLLRERPDIVTILGDRDRLRAYPEGSLGRAYLEFVESENISAEGIRDAAARGAVWGELSPDQDFVRRRMRDTHDLWHAVTGYKGDIVGEASLLGFILAQTWNPGIGLIVSAALLRTGVHPDRERRSEVRHMIFDGFRRGQQASWLPDQPWEDLMSLPVEAVRKRLGIDLVPPYRTLRTWDLAAMAS